MSYLTQKRTALMNSVGSTETLYSVDDFADGSAPSGDTVITLTSGIVTNKFRGCFNITSLYCPNYTGTIIQNTFRGCNSIQKISLPIVTSIESDGFSGNTQLRVADIGELSSVIGNTFNGDIPLSKIILRKTTKTSLGAVSAFTGTRFRATSGYGGVAYVPNDLLATYQADSTWNSLQNITFRKLEDTRYEQTNWLESCNSTCTLDNVTIDVLDNETVALFKATENISHCYENGVELQDTDLVKDRILTSTI